MVKVAAGALVTAPLLGCFLATAAIAQSTKSQPQEQAAGRNEKVCENITVTGSRLATKRFCGTRAEWEERRRLDREAVEAAQRGPCVLQKTAASGRASC